MTRRVWIVVALILGLSVPAMAGKGGDKGKPGGGDPPPPPPAGTLYTHIAGQGYFSMDGNGEQRTFLFGESVDPAGTQAYTLVSPSQALHGGKRWFLVKHWRSELLADNNWRADLHAVSDQGDDLLLWGETGARVYRTSWAKDDSFLSFLVAYPAPGSCEVLRFAVDWSSGAPAINASAGTAVLGGTYARNLPSMGCHDWSADGNQLAYTDRDLDVSPIEFTVRVLDVSSGTDVALASGRHPAWSPVDDRIAYWRDDGGGVSVIDADGSGAADVTVSGQGPTWSPDGAHVMFRQETTRGKGRKAVTFTAAFRVPSTGGQETILTGDVQSDAWPLGWR